MNGVEAALDESMQHWVDWPREQAEQRMSVLGVTPLSDTDRDAMRE